MNVYVEKEKVSVLRMLNGSGVPLPQDEFTVINGFAAVTEEAIAAGAYGGFQVEEGIQVQSTDLCPTENTFATLGQSVYYDPATDTFSDTADVTYWEVGRLTKVKDADGMIVFDKYRYALVVYSDET